MIRIHTKIGDKRVKTLFDNGRWVTLISDSKSVDSTSLLEAGQVHLKAAYALREKVQPCKDWKERFDRDGFIDDDMGCND